MPGRRPSDREIMAKYRQLSSKQQGFVDLLNAIASDLTTVEALCLKMRNQLDLHAYAAWIHEFNTFAHWWSNQF